MFVVQKFRYSALNEIDNQRTSTVAPVVRGFKIDGNEGGRGGMCRVSGSKLSGKELQQNFL